MSVNINAVPDPNERMVTLNAENVVCDLNNDSGVVSQCSPAVETNHGGLMDGVFSNAAYVSDDIMGEMASHHNLPFAYKLSHHRLSFEDHKICYSTEGGFPSIPQFGSNNAIVYNADDNDCTLLETSNYI